VYCIAPAYYLGTPFAYTPMFDLLGLQDAVNSLYSTVLTNQTAFGVQNILVPQGSNISISELSGNLNETEMTPILSSLTGDLLGQLLSTTVNSSNSTLLTALDNNLNFVDLKKLNLNDLKAAITFKDGKVNVKPFDIKYQDIKVNVGGTHGFDQNMNYNLKLDVPAKYLGTEANNLIAKLSPADAQKVQSIPVNAIIGGNFSSPKITTDVKQATTNLVNNLVKQQKEKVVSSTKNTVNSIISNATKPKNDTTKTDVKKDVKTKANNLIKDIFGKKKKEEPKKTE
jgi:hypothetical protein